MEGSGVSLTPLTCTPGYLNPLTWLEFENPGKHRVLDMLLHLKVTPRCRGVSHSPQGTSTEAASLPLVTFGKDTNQAGALATAVFS